MPIRVKRHAVVQPIDQTIRLIPLTQNQNAIVDAADYEWLGQWNWYAHWKKSIQSFYAVRKQSRKGKLNQLAASMHRIILGLGDEDKRDGDHVNHDTLDNRRSNLRIVSRSQNMMNRKKNRTSISGYKGVCFDGSKWKAQIGVNGRNVYLGLFCTPEEAHAAYCDAARRLHGEFAKLD